MKKCLLLLAALALTGCVHAQYKSEYLQQFAAYDCQALNAERSSSAAQLLRVQSKRPSISPAERRGVRVLYIDHIGPPGSISSHERRMRQHAKLEALLNLESSRGCGSQVVAPSV